MAPQKRTAAEAEGVLLDGVDAVVFDIEGTTTPITFVKDTLFPYARKNVESFLTEKYEDADTIKDIAALRELAKKDKDEGKDGVVEIPEASADKADVIKAVVANVKWQMDKDRKSTELKQLQGHIWKKGYEAGDLKAQLFDDVPGMLKVLSDDKALYVYSSGSVEAQKLLFSHTEAGDISGLFEDFFDTNMGQKTEKESYQKIAAKIKLDADKILFLTDLPNEAAAAVSAGWKSALVIRPGNADLEEEHLQNFACIEHLEELYGDEDDEEFTKRPHTDNGEADDDDDEEVDEEEEGEEEEGDDDEGEGEDA